MKRIDPLLTEEGANDWVAQARYNEELGREERAKLLKDPVYGPLLREDDRMQRAIQHFLVPTVLSLECQDENCTAGPTALGEYDVIAVRPGEISLIAVCVDEWPDEGRMEALRAVLAPHGTKRLIYRWHRKGGFPDIRTI